MAEPTAQEIVNSIESWHDELRAQYSEDKALTRSFKRILGMQHDMEDYRDAPPRVQHIIRNAQQAASMAKQYEDEFYIDNKGRARLRKSPNVSIDVFGKDPLDANLLARKEIFDRPKRNYGDR